jgi:hypothetical protein
MCTEAPGTSGAAFDRRQAIHATDARPFDAQRHGAYVCLRIAPEARARLAAAPVPALAERLALTNEAETHDGHPVLAVAFLKRCRTADGQIADPALSDGRCDCACRVARGRTGRPFLHGSGAAARVASRAPDSPRRRASNGLHRQCHAQLRLRPSGSPAVRTADAQRDSHPDEQDAGVVGEGLDGAPHLFPPALRQRPDTARGPRDGRRRGHPLPHAAHVPERAAASA